MNWIKDTLLLFLLGVFLLITGCSDPSEGGKMIKSKEKVTAAVSSVKEKPSMIKNSEIGQIHGIGYPGNDNALYVAGSEGLTLFRESKLQETSTRYYSYMSFQAVDTGFLASGYQRKGTGLKDSLGIVKSMNHEKTWDKLAFYGKGNFNFLSAGFFGGGIYIIIEQPIGKLSPGVYFSIDRGENWNKSKLTNFSSDSLGMIAVQPKNNNIMAISTREGIFYSENYGNTMKMITDHEMVTALAFVGDEILYSSVVDNNISLKKVNPKSGEEKNMIIPFLDYENPVTYLAVDPKNEKRLAFSTYRNDLYESTDGGNSWKILLVNGRDLQE